MAEKNRPIRKRQIHPAIPDAIELFMNGAVIDIYGDINVEGDPPVVWNYADSWSYRIDATGPDGTSFVSGNWTFTGTDALDGTTTAAAAGVRFGTYQVPEPATLLLMFAGLVGLAAVRRR